MSTNTPTSTDTPLLHVREMGVSYNLKSRNIFRPRRFCPLSGISFDLQQGDSLGVIGRNGAGKSTLLQLLAGIIEPDTGTMAVRPGTSTALLSLDLAFFPYLSGRENAVLGGMFQGYTRKEMLAKLDAILDFSELGDFFEEPLSTYSQGMKARLAFSVAFQIYPDVLLVDEVLGVGDAEFQKKSSEVMRERIAAASSTVVLVAHDHDIIRRLCSKVLWVEEGSMRKYGETSEVMAAYESFSRKKGSDVRRLTGDDSQIFEIEALGQNLSVDCKHFNRWCYLGNGTKSPAHLHLNPFGNPQPEIVFNGVDLSGKRELRTVCCAHNHNDLNPGVNLEMTLVCEGEEVARISEYLAPQEEIPISLPIPEGLERADIYLKIHFTKACIRPLYTGVNIQPLAAD